MATASIPFVSSSVDLTSAIPADVMSEFSAAGGEDAVETPDIEASPDPDTGNFETPEPIGDEPEEAAEPAEEEEPAPETEETPEPPKAEEKAAEDLPEGVVSGKNRKGEEGYFVKADRWNNAIYPAHKTIQQISEIIGEPTTIEAIQLRNDALASQEKIYTDLTSGDPAAQSAVLNFMIGQMKEAKSRGEVGSDPTVSMADAFYKTIKEQSPDGYAKLRYTAAKDLVQEMYDLASKSGDKDLFHSMQHLSRALTGTRQITDVGRFREVAQRTGIPFYTPEEMEGLARGDNDPSAQLRADNARLQAELNNRNASTQAAAFDGWKASIDQSLDKAVEEQAIHPALKSAQDAWKAHPEDYKNLVIKPLNDKVQEVLKADTVFRQRIASMIGNARRATSQQIRDDIGAQIKQAFINRANLVVEKEKFPILNAAAKLLANKSTDTHARRTAAQTRTAPKSVGSVPRQVLPDNLGEMPNGVFDPNLAYKQASRLFQG